MLRPLARTVLLQSKIEGTPCPAKLPSRLEIPLVELGPLS